jgi:hypothetical protein
VSGWIKLHRKILKSDMWRNLNSAQRDVAITILLMASYDEGEAETEEGIIKTKPGQCFCSLETIREKCAKDVTIQNVRTALKKLEKWGFITNESSKKGRIITVVNWEVYQTSQQTDKPSETKEPKSEREQTGETDEKKDKVEEEQPKKRNRRRIYPAEFEKFWSVYPRTKKVSKSKAYSNFKALIEEGETSENMIKAAENYAAECEERATPEQFIKHPSTFLGQDRPYLDYIGDDEPEKPAKEEKELFGFEYSDDFLNKKLQEAALNL